MIHIKHNLPNLLAFLLAVLLSQSANSAGITTYSTLTSYEAALGPATIVETFNNGRLNGSLITSVTGSAMFIFDALYGVAGQYERPSQFTTFTFSQPITNFGFYFGDLGFDPVVSQPETAYVFLYSGPLHQATITPWGFPYGFFGLSADTPFDHVTISDGTYYLSPEVNTEFWLDNFLVAGSPSSGGGGSGGGGSGGGTSPPGGAVPEPSTLLLFSIGLTALLSRVASWQQNRNSQAPHW
jgi:uncharacterized membrane protein YgcG